MLTYLDNKKGNESIQRMYDENKIKECELYNVQCQCIHLEDNFLKRNVRGLQNQHSFLDAWYI
jgi:hypothetical protein